MFRRKLLSLALLTAAAITTALPGSSNAAELPPPTFLFQLEDPRIDESSGMAVSEVFSGVMYTHNDSGDTARFFAVGRHGRTKASYTLPTADARDWEDMSAGPRHSLWFGDIGDNGVQRSYISVYRASEPSQLGGGTLASRRYDLRYADGRPHNAEALLVHPTTGQVFIATKQHNGAALYRAPLSLNTSGYNVLTRVASAPPIVTGGDFAPNGERLVLRTYADAYVYRAIGATPRVIDLPVHGESITFTRDGVSLLVGREGADAPVWKVPLA
jgi:hypothetical protein